MEVEVGVMLPQPATSWGHRKLGEARKPPPDRLGAEPGSAHTAISDFQPLELREKLP